MVQFGKDLSFVQQRAFLALFAFSHTGSCVDAELMSQNRTQINGEDRPGSLISLHFLIISLINLYIEACVLC